MDNRQKNIVLNRHGQALWAGMRLECETYSDVEGVSVDFKVFVPIVLGVVLYALRQTEIVTGSEHNGIYDCGGDSQTPLGVKILQARIADALAEHISAYSEIETRSGESGEADAGAKRLCVLKVHRETEVVGSVSFRIGVERHRAVFAVVHKIKAWLDSKALDRRERIVIVHTEIESGHCSVHHFVGVRAGKAERGVTTGRRPFLSVGVGSDQQHRSRQNDCKELFHILDAFTVSEGQRYGIF